MAYGTALRSALGGSQGLKNPYLARLKPKYFSSLFCFFTGVRSLRSVYMNVTEHPPQISEEKIWLTTIVGRNYFLCGKCT